MLESLVTSNKTCVRTYKQYQEYDNKFKQLYAFIITKPSS